MLGYVLGGAAIGAIVGYLIPPGYFFWFVIGSLTGYVAQRYINGKWL
ncbi:MAG TPA: hypothetical protein VGL27_11210 [Negativicutes bacterium]